MGSLEDHKGFGALPPSFGGNSLLTYLYCCSKNDIVGAVYVCMYVCMYV